MSLVDKNNLTYLAVVERFFLLLKGSGLSLSGNDYHLINQWEERGVPAPALCRAIERGIDRTRRDGRARDRRISLTSLKNYIEEEIGQAER